MSNLKIKLGNEKYDVLQFNFRPFYITPWGEDYGETAYIEYGRDYKLHGQLYTPIESLDFSKEFVLVWDENCNPVNA